MPILLLVWVCVRANCEEAMLSTSTGSCNGRARPPYKYSPLFPRQDQLHIMHSRRRSNVIVGLRVLLAGGGSA